MPLYQLTDPQRDALIDAANIVLAGPEDGDAEGISTAVLDRAIDALMRPVKGKAQIETTASVASDDFIGSVRVSPAIYDDERERWAEYTRYSPDLIFTVSD